MAAIGNEGTPGQAGQGGTPEANAFDFERGYNELRPEYTRATQELGTFRERLSEYEQLFEALHDSDPEVQAQAMAALGLELDTGSPESATPGADEWVDPLEEELQTVKAQLDELRSARELEASERETEHLADLRDDYIGEAISYIEDSLKVKFTEREDEALGNLAIAMADEDGVPDVQSAYSLLYGDEGVLETNRKRWIDSKTGAAIPPLGTSIPADQRPKTARERVNYMDERMRALEQQQ